MKEKNRFSSLLKHLMTIADVKNLALARELQFDESYVSKMISGSLMPPKKTCDRVIRTISRCIVNSLDDDSRKTMMAEYQITREKDLEAAIFDNLMAEYNYVIGLKEETGSEVAQKVSYFPELTLSQFMQKTRHPSLRQVKALDVIAAIDILSLDRQYQLALAQLESSEDVVFKSYPNVHFSMLIDLEGNRGQNTYNVSFLLNLLTNLSDIDFQLYSWSRAAGKIIFNIRDSFCIAGMIVDESHCIAVTATEDTANSNITYDRLKSLCSPENLVVRKVDMEDMLLGNDYIRFLLGRNQRWLLGHLTEHMMPDDLFEELAPDYCRKRDISIDELRRIHSMTHSVMEGMEIRVMVYEKALMDFAVSGELDFYNSKVSLTPEQRLRYFSFMCHLPEGNGKIRTKIIRIGAGLDVQHIPDPTLFLSNSMAYLRLVRSSGENNMSVVNKMQAVQMLQEFYDDVWSMKSMNHIETMEEMTDTMYYVKQMIAVQIPDKQD